MSGAREHSVHERTSSEALVNEVHRRAEHQGSAELWLAEREMEMTRRLIVSSERWSKRVVALTIVLVLLTAVLIWFTAVLVSRTPSP